MTQREPDRNTICPHLEAVGSASAAALSRPSHRHRCTALDEPRLVAPRTQATFCLTEQHRTCPFYDVDAHPFAAVSPDEPIQVTLPPGLET